MAGSLSLIIRNARRQIQWGWTVISLAQRRGDDFSVGGAKIGEKQSRQSNSKYNCMHVFFEKGICSQDIFWYNGVCGKDPQKLGSFREFVCLTSKWMRKLRIYWNRFIWMTVRSTENYRSLVWSKVRGDAAGVRGVEPLLNFQPQYVLHLQPQKVD